MPLSVFEVVEWNWSMLFALKGNAQDTEQIKMDLLKKMKEREQRKETFEGLLKQKERATHALQDLDSDMTEVQQETFPGRFSWCSSKKCKCHLYPFISKIDRLHISSAASPQITSHSVKNGYKPRLVR